MIELVNFSKRYSPKDDFIVKDINLKAENAAVTGLLGLNGQGKSTIIKAICTLHYASEGKIIVDNNNIGYMSEVPDFPLNLTVKEYLLFVQSFYFEQINFPLFEQTVKDCELSSVLNKKIAVLSKGFKQRLNIAQALIHNPKNLVLDEPMNGLDPAQIIHFRKLIKKLAETKTILISTHIMQEVEALCDRVYILSDKKIVASGTCGELCSQTNTNSIEEAFLSLTAVKDE